jgi:acetyl esterase/lipase
MKRLFLLIMLSAGFLSNAAKRDTIVPQTYEFVKRGDHTLLMDVYTPTTARPDSACVVFLFGGGFVTGSRTDAFVRKYCQRLASDGFTAIAIDYRLHLREVNFDTITLLKTQKVFRDAINIAAADCAAAIAYICDNAAKWRIATQHIVLCGSSAGAIGSLQLDYCRANSLPPAAELPKDWKPAAVVAFSGAIYADGGKPKYNTAPAPTFFLHGDADRIVNYKKFPPVLRSGLYGPKKLHKSFEKNHYPHWYFIFEGIGHEVASLFLMMNDEVETFVDKTIKGREMFYDANIRDSKVIPTKWSKMGVFDLYKRK